MESLFFELLRVALGIQEKLSHVPTGNEWLQLQEMSVKQSLAGVVFYGVEKLPKEQWPPQDVIFQWYGIVTEIENRNQLTTEVCRVVCKKLEKDGFKACVLKGQANHAYYPKELGNRRTCGDIDVWIEPANRAGEKHPIKETLEYLEREYGLTGLCWLHANIPDVRGIPIEVHLRPSFMNEPRRNRRFLKFFEYFDNYVCQKEIEEDVTIPCMKPEYDVIYQMNHIYRHLIDEGVGLRQIVDYYFLLLHLGQTRMPINDHEYITNKVRDFGMKRFACALMWVLQAVFALPKESLLCAPSEKDGKFLLNEIMLAGNFGHTDPRMAMLTVKEGKLSFQVSKAWRRMKRNMRFFSSYPGEVIFEPYARLWHFAWKRGRLWRF